MPAAARVTTSQGPDQEDALGAGAAELDGRAAGMTSLGNVGRADPAATITGAADGAARRSAFPLHPANTPSVPNPRIAHATSGAGGRYSGHMGSTRGLRSEACTTRNMACRTTF